MKYTSSHNGKKLFPKSPIKGVCTRHHNNNTKLDPSTTTKTRFSPANQKTQFSDGPFFFISFLNFFLDYFFSFIISFFVIFFLIFISFLVLVFFFSPRVHKRETGWDNFFFFFLSRASGDIRDM